MAFTAVGFDGSVDEAGFVGMARYFGPRYSVGSSGSLRVTAGGSGDRAVTIAAGSGYVYGVTATQSGSSVKNLASVSSGSRYDLVVLRVNWETNTASIEVITGSSSSATLPSRTIWSSGNQIEDMPLALVKVTAGQSAAAVYADLRLWAGGAGVYHANHELAKRIFEDNLPGSAGTVLRLPGVTYTRTLTANVWAESREFTQDTAASLRSVMGLGSTVGPVPVANGGTGTTSLNSLRSSLGLGGSTAAAVPIANGGTGATTKANARKALGIASGRVQATTSGAVTVNTGLGAMIDVACTLNGLEFLSGVVPWITAVRSNGTFDVWLIGSAAGRVRTVHWIALET